MIDEHENDAEDQKMEEAEEIMDHDQELPKTQANKDDETSGSFSVSERTHNSRHSLLCLLDEPEISSDPIERLSMFYMFCTTAESHKPKPSRKPRRENPEENFESIICQGLAKDLSKVSIKNQSIAWKTDLQLRNPTVTSFQEVSDLMKVLRFPRSVCQIVSSFDHKTLSIRDITESILIEQGITCFGLRKRLSSLFSIISLHSNKPPLQCFSSIIQTAHSIFQKPEYNRSSVFASNKDFVIWIEDFLDTILSENTPETLQSLVYSWDHKKVKDWIKGDSKLCELSESLEPFRLTGFLLLHVDQREVQETLLPHSSLGNQKRFLLSIKALTSSL